MLIISVEERSQMNMSLCRGYIIHSYPVHTTNCSNERPLFSLKQYIKYHHASKLHFRELDLLQPTRYNVLEQVTVVWRVSRRDFHRFLLWLAYIVFVVSLHHFLYSSVERACWRYSHRDMTSRSFDFVHFQCDWFRFAAERILWLVTCRIRVTNIQGIYGIH